MNEPLRILMVEDSEDDALLLIREIQKGGYDTFYERVETAEAMKSALERGPWDIVLSDYSLPRFDGRTALRIVQETGHDIPFILVSGKIGEETAVEAMKAGALDYVMKDNLTRLLPSVRRELEEAQNRLRHREAQQALRESEKKFFTVFQESPIAMAITSIDEGTLLDFNQEYSRMIGFPREEMIGRTVLELGLWANPSDRESFVKTMTQKGAVKGFPVSVRTKQDNILHVLFSAEIIHIDNLACFLASMVDVSERLKMEEALRLSEADFRRLFENALMGISEASREGRLIRANQAYANIYGYSNPETMITEITDIGRQLYADPQDRVEVLKILDRKGILEPTEFCMLRRDGTRFYVVMAVRRVEDNKGRLICHQATHMDITSRKLMERKLEENLEHLKKTLTSTIQSMAVVVEMRDPYTAGHQRRTAELGMALAVELCLSQDQIDGIRMAGLIHDLGKIAVPAEILSKPTRLSAVEFSLIKRHSQAGYDIVKDIEFPWPIARIILEHHERCDGSGYPNGLTGDQLLIESRILAICDVVESMISHRPYRPALGIDAAIEEITKNRGGLYDPQVVDACLNLIVKKGYRIPE